MKTNYRDISPDFMAHPISGDIGILRDEDAIKQALKNLILTNFYEKYYRKNYGGNVKRYLFQNIFALEKEVIKLNLLDAIAEYEPRVTDVFVEVLTSEQVLTFNIFYTVKSISDRQQLNITLERIR